MGVETGNETVAQNAIGSFIILFLAILFASVLLLAAGPDFAKIIDEQIVNQDKFQTPLPPSSGGVMKLGGLRVSMASQKEYSQEFSEVNVSISEIYVLNNKGEKVFVPSAQTCCPTCYCTAPTYNLLSFKGVPSIVAKGIFEQGHYLGLVLRISKVELVKPGGEKIQVRVNSQEIILEKSFEIIENQNTELGIYFDNYPILPQDDEYLLDTSLIRALTLTELKELLVQSEGDIKEDDSEQDTSKPIVDEIIFEDSGYSGEEFQVLWKIKSNENKNVNKTAVYWDLVGGHGENFVYYSNVSQIKNGTTNSEFGVTFTLPEVSEQTTLFFRVHAMVEGENIYSEEKAIVINGGETEQPPQQYNGPELWFQHDDYVDMDGDNEPEFVPDMLTRWDNEEQWSKALDNTDYYSLHEQLFKTTGADHGMGQKFLTLLRSRFGNKSDLELQKEYLRLILPVLHKHGVKISIHTVGSKGGFVPWEMYGTDGNGDTIVYLKRTDGLDLVKQTLGTLTSVCNELFTNGCPGIKVKLQSVLSGDWERGLQNNVYVALEYMKGIQEEYPQVEFYLGDALLQRRDSDKSKSWNDAYTALYDTMKNDSRGYSHLNFRGIRIEFDKKWGEFNGFETAEGWTELTEKGGLSKVKSFGWKVGMEFNFPYADDEWGYEAGVLRTAAKCQELDMDLDFIVVHSDEGGGEGHGYPYNVFPENRTSSERPTFSSVFNKLVAFYSS